MTFRARDEASAIHPGEFAEFRLQVGPLPAVPTLALPTIQTYSDGTVVSWVEQSFDGTEPDKPAPILRLSDPASDHAHGAARERETTDVNPGHDEPNADDTGIGRLALVVAFVALVLAGLSLVLAGLPLARRKSAE